MREYKFLVVGIDNNGARISWCVYALDCQDAEHVFLSEYKAEVVEIKKLED